MITRADDDRGEYSGLEEYLVGHMALKQVATGYI